MDDRWPALTVHDEDLIAERVVSEHDEPQCRNPLAPSW